MLFSTHIHLSAISYQLCGYVHVLPLSMCVDEVVVGRVLQSKNSKRPLQSDGEEQLSAAAPSAISSTSSIIILVLYSKWHYTRAILR